MQFDVNGMSVFAATGGRKFNAKQPSLVFLHGAGMDHTVWALQSRYFAGRGYNVLALDLPGHGKTGGDALGSIDAMADWVITILDALGIVKAVLIGHSMGSLIALDMAARHAPRASGLGLLGTAAQMPVNEVMLNAAAEDRQEAIDMVTGFGFGPAGHVGGNRGPGLWMMGGGQRLMQTVIAQSPRVLYHDLKACNDFAHGAEHAAAVTQPSFLILGHQDKMTPAKAGQKLAQAMTAIDDGPVVTMLDGVGHMMMLEAPDPTLDAIIAGVKAAAA
ncbi:MAG: alpha/beta hydrolase [Pseudomonadota bacterium]